MPPSKVRGKHDSPHESSLKSILEILPACAYTCDPQGLITSYNRPAVELWGREPKLNDPADRFCGSFELFSTEGHPIRHDQCWMALALANNTAYNGQQIVIQRPDGQRITALAYANPLQDHTGKLTGAINVLVDITEIKRLGADFAATKNMLDLQVAALTKLHELAMRLAHPVGLHEALAAVLETLVEVHHADFGLLSLYDPAGGHLYLGASVGFDQPSIRHMEKIVPGPDAQASGAAFSTRSRVVVEDALLDSRFAAVRSETRAAGIRAAHSTPIITRSDEIFGVLSVYSRQPGRPTQLQMQLADLCARQAAMVMETWREGRERSLTEQRLREANDLLENRVTQRTNELRALAFKLTTAEHRERQRLAQLLHDNLQQLLVAAAMQTSIAAEGIGDPKAAAAVQKVEQLVRECIKASRTLTVELSPPVFQDTNLDDALQWVVRHKKEKYGLEVILHVQPNVEPADGRWRDVLVQAVRELLFNVVKHGKTKTAHVQVSDDGDNLKIVVTDNGAGCDHSGLSSSKSSSDGFGLVSIRERITLLGGDFDFESAPGKGAKATLTVPIAGRHPKH